MLRIQEISIACCFLRQTASENEKLKGNKRKQLLKYPKKWIILLSIREGDGSARRKQPGGAFLPAPGLWLWRKPRFRASRKCILPDLPLSHKMNDGTLPSARRDSLKIALGDVHLKRKKRLKCRHFGRFFKSVGSVSKRYLVTCSHRRLLLSVKGMSAWARSIIFCADGSSGSDPAAAADTASSRCALRAFASESAIVNE